MARRQKLMNEYIFSISSAKIVENKCSKLPRDHVPLTYASYLLVRVYQLNNSYSFGIVVKKVKFVRKESVRFMWFFSPAIKQISSLLNYWHEKSERSVIERGPLLKTEKFLSKTVNDFTKEISD